MEALVRGAGGRGADQTGRGINMAAAQLIRDLRAPAPPPLPRSPCRFHAARPSANLTIFLTNFAYDDLECFSTTVITRQVIFCF